MSISPDERPFDFSKVQQEYFDPEELADRVVWPLVDWYWRGNWRLYSGVADELNITRTGGFKGIERMASLLVTNSLIEGEENQEEIPILGEVSLSIETTVEAGPREMILDKAVQEQSKIEEYDEEDLDVNTGMIYCFDTDGYIQVSSEHLVRRFDGEQLWWEEQGADEDTVEADSDDSENPIIGFWPDTQLHQADLEIIESGLRVLQAPEFIVRAFEAIRQKPLLSNLHATNEVG